VNWKHYAGLALLFLIGYIVGKSFTLPLIPTFSGMAGKMGGGGGSGGM
jgi:hypothetical protein